MTLHRLLRVVMAAAVLLVSASASAGDAFTIKLGEGLASPAGRGRAILFFVSTDARVGRQEPRQAPFFSDPQPIYSVAADPAVATMFVIDASATSFPVPLEELEGSYRVQAVLDTNGTHRGHNAPGNLYSKPMEVALAPDHDDAFTLELTETMTDPARRERPNLVWFEVRSELLSAFARRDVMLKAGVALPPGYDKEGGRSEWGALYIVPGFGGTWGEARSWARALADPATVETIPQCLHIVLDPECPLGHHGFVDSPNMGPWGSALVKELIPALEKRFKLAPRAEGRLLNGHSSGAWSVLWLQLHWPDLFGGCWASAPDPIDFGAFQHVNIYEDANLFVNGAGEEQPSFRVMASLEEDRVLMTLRQELGMEHAIDPDGLSGEQWCTYNAMWSPRDEATGRPRRLANPVSGLIDRDVAAAWQRFDIARVVASDWPQFGPIVRDRVHLACGTRDSFYLERAVERFKELVERLQREQPLEGPARGTIWLRRGADHGNMAEYAVFRWTDEWVAHFKAHGLQ